jgi:hypothetical protein
MPLATALAKIILRGRDMRILRGLARRANQRLQFRNPRSHPLVHLILRKQEFILLGIGQNMKQGRCPRQLESNPNPQRNPFLPTTSAMTLELLAGILAALVRVMQQDIGLAPPPDRHDHSVSYHLGGHVRLH